MSALSTSPVSSIRHDHTPNFDLVIDRRGSDCAKWDGTAARFGAVSQDVLPMWVADMDFHPPAAVQDTLEKLTTHGVYGYAYDPNGFENAAINWLRTRHGWTPHIDAVVSTHGVLSAISVALQAYSNIGDTVIVFSPVYHVYQTLIHQNQRVIMQSPLVLNEGRFEMNLAHLEQMLSGSERIVLLCSPHNPGGTVWTKQELHDLASFCARNDLILVSDEIHHDLVFPGHVHCVVSQAAPEYLDRIVVLVAPTKTFNIAAAMTGLTIIEDDMLRKRFEAVNNWVTQSENGIGRAMSKAAYSGGRVWLAALLCYLEKNRDLFERSLNDIPGVRVMPLASTYLAWVDFSGTGLTDEHIQQRCCLKAGVLANAGTTFGPGGSGWMRFNLAMPQTKIQDAVMRLQYAFGAI